MNDDKLNIVVENEREWRQYVIQKVDKIEEDVDRIDKALSAFKVRVMSVASVLGGATGFSVDYLKSLFTGS